MIDYQFTRTYVVIRNAYGQLSLFSRDKLSTILFDELKLEEEELTNRKARLKMDWQYEEKISDKQFYGRKHKLDRDLARIKDQIKKIGQIKEMENWKEEL